MTDQTLSDKKCPMMLRDFESEAHNEFDDLYYGKDVREFIRQLKEELFGKSKSAHAHMSKLKIDKLAGSRLVNSTPSELVGDGK
jgi:hypothetical protein